MDSKNKITWVRFEGFWRKFQYFDLNYNEIKWLTRYSLEQHLKGKVHPTRTEIRSGGKILEQHLKGKVYPTATLYGGLEDTWKHLKGKGTSKHSNHYE